ncbi:hypothetical protein BHE74_00007919, partial [Ensete ventricosum]
RRQAFLLLLLLLWHARNPLTTPHGVGFPFLPRLSSLSLLPFPARSSRFHLHAATAAFHAPRYSSSSRSLKSCSTNVSSLSFFSSLPVTNFCGVEVVVSSIEIRNFISARASFSSLRYGFLNCYDMTCLFSQYFRYTLPTWAEFEMGMAPVFWKTTNGLPPTSHSPILRRRNLLSGTPTHLEGQQYPGAIR